MFKGLFLFYLLSVFTRNPFLALIILVVIYIIMDKAYFGFLPDFGAPFKRNGRIKTLLAELRLNPANATAAQELGVLFFEKRNFKKALEYFNLAHKKVTNSARLYLYIGMSNVEIGNDELGKEALDKAVEIDRRVGHGLAYIYLLRYELNLTESNLAIVNKLEEGLNNFANTENLFRVGMIYKKLGNRHKAREFFHQAVIDYSYVPKTMRRIHRKWAILARINKLV